MKLLSEFKSKCRSGVLKTAVQFIKFGIVGASNTLISLGIYYLFVWFDSSLFIWGYTIGFIVSVFNAYYWNRRHVFSDSGEGHFKQIVKTFISYGATFLLGLVLLYVMVERFSISKNVAPVLNLLVTIPLNFLMIKLWTFKEKINHK